MSNDSKTTEKESESSYETGFIGSFKVTKLPNSEVAVEGKIPLEVLEKERAGALKELGKGITVDGFRRGHIPEAVLLSKVGEMNLLTEMAERAIERCYPEIIKTHEVEAVGYPKIEITKIAPKNPLGFKATVAVIPEIKLPDYKKIARETNNRKESDLVTNDEVDKQIEDILRQKVAYERLQNKARKNAEHTQNHAEETHTHADGTVHAGPAHDDGIVDLPTPASADGKSAKVSVGDSHNDSTTESLPGLTDDLAKSLGKPGQFKDVADLKTKLREHLEIQKKQDVTAAHRAKITDEIIKDSQFELPKILIDGEINQMFAQMNEDLTRANLKMDDYLSHIKKTKEDLIKEWTPAAEKRARLQLVLNEIAKVENITPDKAKLEEEVNHLLSHYKNADEMRVRIYVATVLTNEAVMKLLERQ